MNREDLKAEILKSRKTFLKDKHRGNYYSLQRFTNTYVCIQNEQISYIELFNDYVWIDGSICGIKQD